MRWMNAKCVAAACLSMALVLLSLAGCAAQQRRSANEELTAFRRQGIGPNNVTPDEIQSQVMGFSDSFMTQVAGAADDIIYTTESTVLRSEALAFKVSVVSGAIEIASSANPVTSLLDMAVLVSLSRASLEELYIPRFFGDEGQLLLRELVSLEVQIWDIMAYVATQETVDDVQLLIDEFKTEHPDLHYVSHVRLGEWASFRERSFVGERTSGGLLTLFMLDPMANLSPAAREIAQSRLLVERMFFVAQRMPFLLTWNMEGFVYAIADTKEANTLLSATENVGSAADRIATSIEELPDAVRSERAALVNDLADRVGQEREAAITHFFDQFAIERRELLDEIDAREERLSGIMGELRGTIDAGTELATALDATTQSTTVLITELGAMKSDDAEPVDTLETLSAVRDTAATTTQTVIELEKLVTSLNELVTTTAWDDRSTQLDAVGEDLQQGMVETIDHFYGRAVRVVLIAAASLLLVLVIHRLLIVRMGPRGAT